jgi:branched-chain amino acid transport system substrate-binding protein
MNVRLTSPPRRPLFAAVAFSAVLATTLVACGSDTPDSSAPDTTAAGTTATDIDAATLRIGLEAPLSGAQEALGQGMLRGAELAAGALNADGGVLGRQVEIVPIDDQADPDDTEAEAEAAVAAGLDAVVGPYNSGAGAVSLPIYIDAGLVPLRLTSADTTAGLGFTLQPMTSQIAPTAATAIVDWAGAETVAIVVDDTQEYTNLAAEATEALLTNSGVTITSVTNITPGSTSYADAVTTALADTPDLIYVVTYYPEAAAIAADVQASGSDVTCMIDYGGFDDAYITSAGIETAQTCSVLGVPSPGDFTGSDALVSAFEDAFDTSPGSWSPYTYDSVMLLADAIERANGTEASALTTALAATSGWSGWTGTVAFEADTGNRVPAPVTVNTVTNDGTFTVDPSWATAVGFAL